MTETEIGKFDGVLPIGEEGGDGLKKDGQSQEDEGQKEIER